MLTAALPSGVLGPVDFCALRRLASNCLSVAISFLTNKAKLGSGYWKRTQARMPVLPPLPFYPHNSAGFDPNWPGWRSKLFVFSVKNILRLRDHEHRYDLGYVFEWRGDVTV